jgi:iron complex outermembrane receptor protein
MSKNKSLRSHLMTFLALAAAQALLSLPAFAQEVHHFNVQATNVPAAVHTLGEQSGVQIFASADTLTGKQLNAVIGDMTTDVAFQRFLAGTGLSAKYVGDRAVALVSNTLEIGAAEQPSSAGVRSGAGATGKSTDGVLIAQAQETSPAKTPSKDQQSVAAPKKPAAQSEQLEEILVTGSRLLRIAKDGPQDVKTYVKEQLESSGQNSIADFLNTLSEVSVSSSESEFRTFGGTTTVQLHGLPLGTTLVLINGRRVELSGVAGGGGASIFDLNNIPLAAVERIEVVPAGSSAVYGADGIAGIVNIILKQNFEGFESNVRYRSASGTNEKDASFALGEQWNKSSLSVIGSFLTRSALMGFDRPLSANQDYRRFGGPNSNASTCPLGNVFSVDGSNIAGVGAPYAAVPAGFTGPPSLREFAGTAGTLNQCSFTADGSIIPATRREGVLASWNYNLATSVELFAELMYSHTEVVNDQGSSYLFGQPGFQSYSVSASNPYNPFGETVGVSKRVTGTDQSQPTDTDFLRPLLGVRGTLFNSWRWELAAWKSEDRTHITTTSQFDSAATQTALNSADPTNALNPFIDGPLASPQILEKLLRDFRVDFLSRTYAVNGFVRGPIVQLPSGPVEVVVGGEYDSDKLETTNVSDPFFGIIGSITGYHRTSDAGFGEIRVPLLANRTTPQAGERLAVTVAARFDHSSDFGSKTTPQFGIEWRPTDTLLLRGSYGHAFKAPALSDLHSPTVLVPEGLVDPLRGNQVETVNVATGGNPNLQPETGQSRTFGLVYSSNAIPGLRLSVTHWGIDESDNIQAIDPQVIIDNAALFPGAVIRAPGTNGQPGVITLVSQSLVNFGQIKVAGNDFQIDYKVSTRIGEFMPSLSATVTDHYTASLTPNAAATDRTSKAFDDGNFAPRWKGRVALNWRLGPYSVNAAGRYVGRYLDYQDTPNSNQLGAFWLCDANVRYAIGQTLVRDNRWLGGAYVTVGAINLFNTAPQFSNYLFDLIGYDPSEADIRGRFIYAQLGVKW